MQKITTRIDPGSREFVDNADHMFGLLEQWRQRLDVIREGGPSTAHERHRQRGKLTARERIGALLDQDGQWLELSSLAATGMYGDEVPAAGIITGIGKVQSRDVVIVANDATVKGGTYYPITVKKHLRAQEIAMQNALP